MAKPLLLFYILVLYVLLQLSWWAYLLIDLNTQITSTQIQLNQHEIEHHDILAKTNASFEHTLQKKIWMVYGEGVVFVGILIFGIHKFRQAFRSEFALAQQQKNFLLSITHEFKSPLAAIKLNLQTLGKHELDKPRKEMIIRRSLSETERIHELVENVLLAARLESHNYEIFSENIDFSDYLEKLTGQLGHRPEQLHRFIGEIESNVIVKGDRLALSSLVNNILENAEKYSPENTTIQVKLRKRDKEAILSISDQGYGIPEAEKKKIFQKFYRIGNEDTRKTKGTGLGLFIVKNVVDLHHGHIHVKSEENVGTTFEIHLPLA